MFSTAVKSIDKAIKTSIILTLGINNPEATKPKVRLCAKVKTEHWRTTVFNLELRKKSVRIKRM
jgi:hypothetical protein